MYIYIYVCMYAYICVYTYLYVGVPISKPGPHAVFLYGCNGVETLRERCQNPAISAIAAEVCVYIYRVDPIYICIYICLYIYLSIYLYLSIYIDI